MTKKRGKEAKKVSRINWDRLKVEYFQSEEELSVSKFLRRKLTGKIQATKIPSPYHKVKSKGWRGEKEEYWNKIKEEAIKENKKKLRQKFEIDIETLNRDHQRIVDIVTLMLNQAIEWEEDKNGKKTPKKIKISTKELKTLYAIIKNEKGEPDRTTKQELQHDVKDLDKFLDEVSKKLPNPYGE